MVGGGGIGGRTMGAGAAVALVGGRDVAGGIAAGCTGAGWPGTGWSTGA
jgi:hypothetical protein